MADRERIVDRIRKLLELSKSSNPNEAALAASRAAALMTRHGIENVEEQQADDDPVSENHDCAVVVGKSRRVTGWRWNLAWTVAKTARCEPIPLHRVTDGKFVESLVGFVGRRSDAQACSYMYQYLTAELVRLHKEMKPTMRDPAMRELLKARGDWRGYLRRWSRNFYIAAVEIIRQRTTKVHEDIMRQASSTALVHVSKIQQEVDDLFREARFVRVKVPGPKISEVDAGIREGVKAGSTIELDSPRDALGPGMRELRSGSDESLP